MEALLMIAMALTPILIGIRILLILEADNEDVGFNDWDFEIESSK